MQVGMLLMKGSLSARKISGKTGRSAQVLLNDERTYHVVVQRFVQTLGAGTGWPRMLYWWWLLLSYPVAWRTLFEIGKARSTSLCGTYFRSQRFKSRLPAPSSSLLGPPPRGKQTEGRYNYGRGVVLYLSRSARVAALESRNNPKKPWIFIQRFELSFPNLRYIRLAQDLESTAPVLQYLLIESEYLPEQSPLAHPYKATQFLAFLCRLRGVHAIEYPSVWAGYKNDPDAVNMVILPPAVDAAGTMMKGDPVEYR